MTTRLLRASLGSPTYDDMRDTLRPTHQPPVLSGREVQVHARPLPLFREAAGGLTQAVRVGVSGPGAGELRVRLMDGTSELAAGTATPQAPADLFIPEVASPRQVTLAAADLGSATITVSPQRKWTVYVVHHSHLDIGYTDRQGVVLRHHLEYLDSALELAGHTDDWPDDARFRWTVESALPVRRWLQARSAAAVERFVSLARQGRIEVTAMPYQLHTEACSIEELHRLLRSTDELREQYGIPVTSAMHTDVPGAVIGFVDALAAAGVRYLSAAHNWAGRSVPFLHGGQELGRPFWWRSPAGNRVLVWFTDTPHGMAYMEGNVVGLAESYPATVDLLPGYLDALAHRPVPYRHEAFGWSSVTDDEVTRAPYPHDLLHLRVQGGNADNAGPSVVPPSVVRDFSRDYAWPRLRMATNTDFFAAAEERLGERLPEHTGDWTDWWADGLGSGARPLGYARRAQHAVRHAETLHTLAGVDTTDTVGAVYDKLGLFDEHTWGAANPWHDHEDGFDSGGLQWARKCELAYSAADDAEDLRHAGARQLGAGYGRPAAALASFLVLNPGPAARGDTVSAFLPASTVALETPVSLRDARTGAELPHHEEVLRAEEWPTRPTGRRLVCTVADVPACGAVRVDVVAGDGPVVASVLAGEVLDNGSFRLAYDPDAGVITSLVDLQTGRELVNTGAYAGMNQYVYDRYSTAAQVNHLSGHIEAAGTHDLALLASRTLGRRPSVVRARHTAAGQTLEVALDGDGVDSLHTTVTLPAGVPRVDITNRLHKQATSAKESVFFAFPFAGQVSGWELTGGAGGPDAPTVPGAARHMQPIRHWVTVRDGDAGLGWATLEAPLVMFGDLYLPYSPFPPTVRPQPAEPGTLYSWALNNIWDTNFPGQQQGETTFRYAVAAGGAGEPDAVIGRRAAAGLTDPLVAVPLSGAGEASPPAVHRFVEVSDPRVEVSSLSTARGDHDLVVHLRSVAPDVVDTQVRVAQPVRAAHVGTGLESDLRPLAVRDGTVDVAVPPGGICALVLDLTTNDAAGRTS